jgi:preprotein translocase subunit YajC
VLGLGLWLVILVGLFYFLLWKPQQRRMRAVRALQSELEEGDDVLTTSGIYARVVRLGEDDADLEIAPATVIRVARGAIGQRIVPGDITDGDITDGARGDDSDDGTGAG